MFQYSKFAQGTLLASVLLLALAIALYSGNDVFAQNGVTTISINDDGVDPVTTTNKTIKWVNNTDKVAHINSSPVNAGQFKVFIPFISTDNNGNVRNIKSDEDIIIQFSATMQPGDSFTFTFSSPCVLEYSLTLQASDSNSDAIEISGTLIITDDNGQSPIATAAPTPKPGSTMLPPDNSNDDCPLGTYYNAYRKVCFSDFLYSIGGYSEYGSIHSWDNNSSPFIYTLISDNDMRVPIDQHNNECFKMHEYGDFDSFENVFPEVGIDEVEPGSYRIEVLNEVFFEHYYDKYNTIDWGYLFILIMDEPLSDGFYTETGIRICPHIFNPAYIE